MLLEDDETGQLDHPDIGWYELKGVLKQGVLENLFVK